MMNNNEKMPCEGCMEGCGECGCKSWQDWFAQGWEAMNRFYQWHRMDALGKEPRCFTYELPHIVVSPCQRCCCESWCDTPCSLRLKWWDERMDIIRRRVCRGAERETEAVR